MRKFTVLLTILVLAALLLCACQCEHEWAEADCTTPKTCTLCGETEGEALGHSWADATCSAPKTCTVCGETEGTALEHVWADATCSAPKTCTLCGETEGEALAHTPANEANYQQASVCSVCGEVIEEALQADFEKYGLTCYSVNDVLDMAIDYVTITYEDDPPKETVGKITLSDYKIGEEGKGYTESIGDTGEMSAGLFDGLEGYEWRTVHVEMTFSDENAQNGGCSIRQCFEDYYTIVFHYDNSTWETLKSTDTEYELEGTYSVNYNSEIYDQCLLRLSRTKYDWSNDVAGWSFDFAYRVPVGYDGTVFGFYSAANTWEDGQYIYDVADEDTLFFRLD